MYEWNTDDGGPCFFRPTDVWSAENPSLNSPGDRPVHECYNTDGEVDENGLPLILDQPWCKGNLALWRINPLDENQRLRSIFLILPYIVYLR